jgi:signal transduction histidine kinase/DNA-binding response OmpR family regulator
MLTIIISPPWWETWCAYTLYGLIIIGIILSWRNHAIKRIKLKHQAQHLTELDTLKARFFANISHEFRTPVTLILGPLKDLYDEASKQSQKTVFAAMIRNAHRLLRLINQLLELSKLEVGKMRLKASLTNAVDFFREISSAYESLALDRKIKYFFYSEISELSIYVDRQKMETIVHNLLSNAFKFTKEGQVILNLKVVQNKWAVIIVKDSGIGIPSDRLNKVFDRFYQVDSMQTRGYEGSGLGLALTKEFVELHHGRITVESIEGQETTFTVWIPLGLAHLRPEEIVDSNVVPEGETFSENHILPYVANVNEIKKENVSSDHPVLLIVEDNAEMRHFIQKSLSAGYSIVEAENGNEGARKAVELIPDLIICDIMMPEMDGYELCHLIKTNELTSHIPVILLTAKGDQESKIAGLRIRADDYLSKPFDVDELKLIVRNHIEEVRKLRQHFSKEIRLEPRQILITSLDEKFLTKAISIIESHMDDESFSIEDFSREAGCSDIQFYRKVKALTGQTPSTFLRTIRLQRAAALLGKNSDTVSQVAYSVGFSSLSYFNKCFKQLYGMTPGNFAASSKGRTSPILPKTN